MAITNTKFKITERTRRQRGKASFSDHTKQPRLLQPVTDSEDITVANGFVPGDLIPGDMIFALLSIDNAVPALLIRQSGNTSWHELRLVAGAVTVNDLAD